MRQTPPAFFLAALLALGLAAIVAGCGGVPGNAVASVNGDAITKSDFNHWMAVAAKSSGQPNAQIPKPPDFKACVDQKKKLQPKPVKGKPTLNDSQIKQQCKSQFEALRNQVLQLLISFRWVSGEAKDLGVSVSDTDVRKSFDTQKKQSFPKDADFQKFLAQSGQTVNDILLRVRLDQLSNKIREKVTKGKDQVSDNAIQAYYDKSKARFSQPERRDLRIVLTKTAAKADQAKQAIKRGQSFAAVAKKFSIDQASKAQGGKLPAVAKGQQEKALDDAIFAAKKGQLSGPVKTQFGYYVFEVTKITAASQQTLAQSKPTIKQLLASQQQQKALDEFVKKFRAKWRARTDCREGFVTQDCKNAPKPTPVATPPGAVPVRPAPTVKK